MQAVGHMLRRLGLAGCRIVSDGRVPARLGLVAVSRRDLTLLPMGLVQALDYTLPTPSAVQRAMRHISSSRPGAWLLARSLPQIDKFVLRISQAR
jgi:hypothetical protein